MMNVLAQMFRAQSRTRPKEILKTMKFMKDSNATQTKIFHSIIHFVETNESFN